MFQSGTRYTIANLVLGWLATLCCVSLGCHRQPPTSPPAATNSSADKEATATAPPASATDSVSADKPAMPPATTALNSDREPVTFEELKAQREQLDRTVWSPEVEAQRHEDRIVELWDRLRAADDPWQVFVEFELDALQAYSPQTPRTHELGITEVRFGGEPHTLDRDGIVSQIKTWRNAGYHIVQTEWHHTRFERQQDGPP
ncbi:MAG: hypothetical protein KDB23_11830, partial [Planctomycetales bacterium]|nr:hypothetical protein [Planctomycetales bacterium]